MLFLLSIFLGEADLFRILCMGEKRPDLLCCDFCLLLLVAGDADRYRIRLPLLVGLEGEGGGLDPPSSSSLSSSLQSSENEEFA